MHRIVLATEDELSETVGLRLITEQSDRLEPGLKLRSNGFGYLKSKLPNFIEMAALQPVLLITDLDRKPCAPVMIAEWMRNKVQPANLLFRVAVREIESWLLADREAFSRLLCKKAVKYPKDTDSINDPKELLLNLAKTAPGPIRRELVAERGAIASQGLGYNATLCEFVRKQWNPERAAMHSRSLEGLRACLRKFGQS